MTSPGSLDAGRLADTTPPSIQQPANVTVASTGPIFSQVTFTVNATDPDDDPSAITIVCSWGNFGKAFPSGTTTQTLSVGTWNVTCHASDPAGNTSGDVSFTITVTPFVDTTPPVIQVTNLTVPASTTAGTTVYYNVGAVDPDDEPGWITVTCDHNLAGGLFPIGVTTVTCNARDRAGNNAAPASFTITVTGLSGGGATTATTTVPVTTATTTTATTATTTTTTTTTAPPPPAGTTITTPPTTASTAPAVDATAPTISRHTSIRTNATSPAGAVVTFRVTAADPGGTTAPIPVSCSFGSGSTFPLGAGARTKLTTVTCNARDAAGNPATPMSFAVAVLGVHDQLVTLENQVRASRLAARSKAALLTELVQADRYFAAGDRKKTRSTLGSFVMHVLGLPLPLAQAPTKWIGAATRIRAVVG